MLIQGQYVDDLKTDRKDITPPLPMIMRLVPLLFYCSLLFLVVIGSVSFVYSRVEAGRRDNTLAQVTALKGEIAAQKTARSSLEAKIRESTDLEAWVLASMPIQPLVVNIVRSMGPQSAIVSLSLERDAETPSQLRLGLRLNTDSDKQLEKTLDVIRGMNYREFSPTQTRARGDLDYRASLLWQSPAGETQTPTERTNTIAPL